MANTILTPDVIAREATMILSDNLVAPSLMFRGDEADLTAAKVGDTVKIKSPAPLVTQEFTTTTTVQDLTESSVNLVLEKHFDITVGLTAKELTLDLESFSRQVIAPAVTPIAESINSYALGKYVRVPYYAGSASTPAAPTTLATLAAIDRVLNDNKCPPGSRNAVIDPATQQSLLGIANVITADNRGDGGTALEEAAVGRVMGMNWFMSQGIATHTAGTASDATMAVNNGAGYAAGIASLNIDGATTTDTLLVGDILEIAGSGNHVVTADNTATSGAFTAVTIYPALRAAVVDDAVVTGVISHTANLVFHPMAFALAIVPLELPMGARGAYINENGIGIRVVMDYTSSSKTDAISFDVLVGCQVRHPELACRILAAA